MSNPHPCTACGNTNDNISKSICSNCLYLCNANQFSSTSLLQPDYLLPAHTYYGTVDPQYASNSGPLAGGLPCSPPGTSTYPHLQQHTGEQIMYPWANQPSDFPYGHPDVQYSSMGHMYPPYAAPPVAGREALPVDTGSNEAGGQQTLVLPAVKKPTVVSRYKREESNARRSSSTPASSTNLVCDICGSDFTKRHNLESHIISHFGERLHSCPDCGVPISRKTDVSRHQKLYCKNRPKTSNQ